MREKYPQPRVRVNPTNVFPGASLSGVWPIRLVFLSNVTLLS